ncbi:hypothetical protein GX48_07655 [Paracoccidioides brasiliensis]|nr:hypothetical protein GX48_07655 [Paracoccidioides brasiliensis]
MEPPSSPTPAGSSKSINVTPIHLNLRGLMASELLAAHEAKAQKSHAEALAAANMLDQIEDLDGMKAKGLSRALALGSITIKSTGFTGATDARASIYAKTAADNTNVAKTPATISQKPLLRNNLREKKTSQILTCLPSDHLVHKASSITTLRKLKTELPESLTAVITAVQVIFTDIVIISRSLQDMKTLLVKKNDVAAALINAQIEKKKH